MPIQHIFESEKNLIHVTLTGEISPAEMLHNTLQIEPNHPDYRPGMNSLVDLSSAKIVGANFNIVFQYSSYMTEIEKVRGLCNWALVSSNMINYGLLRMFTLINSESQIQMKVFNNLDEAQAWLL